MKVSRMRCGRTQRLTGLFSLSQFLASKNNSLAGYYDGGTPQLTEHLPPDIDLVYWDYYHTSSASYAAKIEQHRELGCANPWVASK